MSAIRAIKLPQGELAREEKTPVDLTVLVPILLLVGLGIAMVFSASIPTAAARESEDIYYYLKRELLFAGVGLAAMYAVARVSMEFVRKQAGVLLALTFFFLGLVLVVGIRVNGAKSWLPVPGTSLHFQPSEMAKLILVIAAARYFAQFPQGVPTWRRVFPPMAVLASTAALIAVQPDMGTAAVLVIAMLAYYHIAGAKLRHLLGAAGIALAIGALMVSCNSYQRERIEGFALRTEAPFEADYHTTQALIAMGSGGLTGRGYCGSTEKYFYLPAAITDSILAVIGEELGFLAVSMVLALFAFLVWRGMLIAVRAADRFSGLVAAGVTLLLATQALINVAVVTGAVPATGVPLPFVSYGGSSLLFSLIGVGLLLNVSRARCSPEQKA